jgi:hypothetical protein
MVELNDLIHVHPNTIDDQICNYLINFYENSSQNHERIVDNLSTFTELNFTENLKDDPYLTQIHNYLIELTIHHKNLYYEYVDKRVFPEDNAYEQFKIKKYNTGGVDQFATHSDVNDYASSRRYLSFIWYLNDVEDGGRTIFRDYQIIPKKGTLLIFPPLWMFPYKGEPPISDAKYILSTYLHYL